MLAYKRSQFEVVRHFRNGIADAAERVRKPEGKLYQLQLWRSLLGSILDGRILLRSCLAY